MLLPLALASTLIQLRPDAPALTFSQASTMSAAALGNALLAPGHAPAVAKYVDQNDDPPSPPGFPVQARISLDLAAAPSSMPHFCQRSIAVIRLRPAVKRQDGTISAAAPDALIVQSAYQWARGIPSAATCAASTGRFFAPREQQQETAISTVRLFVRIQEAARRRRLLPFTLTIDNDMSLTRAGIYRDNPGDLNGKKPEILTDARKTLMALPADGIWWAGASGDSSPDPLQASDLIGPDGRKLEGRLVQVLDNWTVGMVLDAGRVVRVRVRKQIPAPF